MPAGATSGPIQLKVVNKTVTGPSFTVITPAGKELSIGGINPSSGKVGDQVTISGCGFKADVSQNTVKFNGTLAQVVSVSGVQSARVDNSNDDSLATKNTVASDSSDDGAMAEPALAQTSDDAVSAGGCGEELVAVVPDSATTGPIQITVGGDTVTGPTFTVNGDNNNGGNAPTISADITPDSGPAGTEVTITGTNFSTTKADNTVKFGSTAATVTSASATELKVTVPGGLTVGTAYEVTETVGGKTATAPNKFTVTAATPPAPTISANITPDSGPVGTTVTIKGKNFATKAVDNTVKFGSKAAAVTSASATELKVTVPSGLTVGTAYEVTEQVSGNSQVATAPNKFTVTKAKPNAPTISANITPDSGPAGTEVTITGTNFSTTKADNTVKFGSTAATVTSASATELKVTVPSGLTVGTAYVVTETVAGQSATAPNKFTVTAATPPAPTISANITPDSGPVGTTVTIKGTNFATKATDNTVKFGSKAAAVTSASATELKVTVPSGLTVGTSYAVTEQVSGNSQVATAPNKFTVTKAKPNAPTISANITPDSGPVGTEVTITGTNFSTTKADNTVKFGSTAATVTSASATELKVTVPNGLTVGTAYAVTETVAGQSATAPNKFTVTAATPPAPTISANITPDSGPVGTTVTIKGTNFATKATDNTVKFGSKAAVVTSASATELKVTVPSGLTVGTSYAVTEQVSGNSQVATAPNKFTVTKAKPNAPTISANITPDSGPVGTEVTITGTNFSTTKADNTVKFGSTAATVTSASATELKVTVPNGLTVGTAYAVTETVAGQSATAPNKFTVTAPAPTISANITPDSGPIGTEVTITGTNFSTTKADNTVKFGSTVATVTSASATELKVTVPNGLTVGTAYAVTETVGGKTATAPNKFTVTAPAPTITSISPTQGQVGTQVTINGTNFSATNADNTVKFGSSTATISSATTTKLVVAVPNGLSAGTYDVTETVNGQTATSPDQFVVTNGVTPVDPIVGSNASLQTGTSGVCLGCGFSNKPNIIDGNTDSNYGTVNIGAGVAGGAYVQVNSVGTIPSGGQAGFVVAREGSQIGLGLLGSITVTTYLNGTQQEQVSGSSTLKLDLLSGSTTKAFLHFKTTKAFNAIRINFGGVANLAKYDVYAAYGGKPAAAVAGPSITKITPLVGPVGTTVTIDGNNFAANKTLDGVTFNGTSATIQSATSSKLVVDVPSGATSGPVKVTVGSNAATGPKDFTVGSLPLSGSDLSATAQKSGVCVGCTAQDANNVIDADVDNFAEIKVVLGILNASANVDVSSTTTYAAGDSAGFTITQGGGLLGLSLLNGITVTTYLNGTQQESKSASNLLGVKLLRNGQTDRRFVGFKTTKKFDEIKITFGGSVIVNKSFEIYSVFNNYYRK